MKPLLSVIILGIVWIIISIQIYLWREKHKKEMLYAQQKGKEKMEKVKQIRELLKPFFTEYDEKFILTTEKQILDFVQKCKIKKVPIGAWEQLVEFYGVTNGVPCLNGFDFHACNNEIIFEWWNEDELWLGQCNDDILRWKNNEFCLGDASNVAYSDQHKFPTLIELLQKGFEEWF
jgi:hypothetical protein